MPKETPPKPKQEDRYKNFQELNACEKRGEDFEIEKVDRGSEVAVIAIHGGRIEPGTTEIARHIAGEDLSFYSFIGIKPNKGNSALHITSNNFDEPECLELTAKCGKIFSVHGQEAQNESFIMLGGLDKRLGHKISRALSVAGFVVKEAPGNLKGENPSNICNRGSSGAGVQLELSKKLRDNLLADGALVRRFVEAVRFWE